MKDLTKNEINIYTKMLNNKWDEVEELLIKENISNSMLVLEIFAQKKWDIALKLLKQNKEIDLNKMDKLTNNTLLMMAIADNTSNANKVAQFLIDNNARLDLINKEGLTALMIACRKSNLDMFRYLIKQNGDINEITHKSTVLMSAIEGGNTQIISEVLQKHGNINVVIDGKNALSLAIKNKRSDIANMLIYQGITIPNQDIVVDYLINTRDINLIYYVLDNDNSSNIVKDKLIKALIYECSMTDLLKIGDIYFRQNLARIFFKYRHNFKEQKQAIDAFLQSDVKEYVKDNFRNSIKAFLIDCMVENLPDSYISSIESECKIKEYSNHFEQISRSVGMRKNAIEIYLLILCQHYIYQQTIEGFLISTNELDAIISYNLINSMEDEEFRQRYMKVYFERILKCDKELLGKLQQRDTSMMTSIYNWIWGIKDDISDLHKDIHTILENNLLTYNLDELGGFVRMNNDNRTWAKDTLYYIVMSIRYLVNKLRDVDIDDLKDILTKKDDNIRVIQSILNGKNIKLCKATNNSEILYQNSMNYAIDNEYVFVRGIGDVYRYASQSIHNETHIDIELRKGLRTKGKPTLTKKCCDKNGNINRSCTMINFGTQVFGRVGLGFIKKDSEGISLVASRNVGTGTGRKRDLTRVIKRDSFIDSKKPIKEQLYELFDYLKRGGGKQGHNEVIIDLQYPKDVSFIYYAGDRTLDFLSAVYIQRKYESNTKRKLPIYKISSNFHYPIKKVCTKRQLKQALEEVMCKNTTDILEKNSIDFILSFKDELKAIPSCKIKVEQFLKCEMPEDIYQAINIAKAIGAYQSFKKQNEYLAKYTNIFIQKQNFINFMKSRLRKKDYIKRKNRSIDLYIEIMDEICKISSPEVMEAIKSVSCETFKSVCEYGIKRNDITSIDNVFERCKDKPYLTLDDKTKSDILEMMEDKQKKQREFCMEYNISI